MVLGGRRWFRLGMSPVGIAIDSHLVGWVEGKILTGNHRFSMIFPLNMGLNILLIMVNIWLMMVNNHLVGGFNPINLPLWLIYY